MNFHYETASKRTSYGILMSPVDILVCLILYTGKISFKKKIENHFFIDKD